MQTNDAPVIYSSADGIAEIRFNRPDRLNVLDLEMAQAFAAAVERVTADETLRVVVISSEGRAFVAGGDLAHFQTSQDRRAAAAELIDPLHGALKMLAAAPVISLGSVKGAVAGAGMSLALNFDLLVAADDATFNLAYARIGAPPDCGGSWALPRLVGVRRALEIALLSDTVGADEALRLGLANRIVPRDQLEAETARLAARLAAGAPMAQARIKELMRTSLGNAYAEQLDAEAQAFGDCAVTDDFSEAVEAFFARRKPVFKGV